MPDAEWGVQVCMLHTDKSGPKPFSQVYHLLRFAQTQSFINTELVLYNP